MRALVVGAVLALAAPASAAPPTEPIVVASGDPAFAAAVGDALAAAGMRVVATADAPPAALGNVNADSRVLAEREHATATVWLVFDFDPDRGATLVTYDHDLDRMLVRSLPYHAPLNPEQAAEAARMARTMLRTLRVAPDLDLPPPHAVDAPAVRARAATMPVELAAARPAAVIPPALPALPPQAQPPQLLAIAAATELRAGGAGGGVDLAGTVSAIWRPDALGAALAVGFAPRSDVATADLTGAIADTSVALVGRMPWRIADRFVLAADTGVAVHRIALSGRVSSGERVDSPRYDPAARVGGTVSYDRGAVAVGVDVSADWLLRRQSYDVGAMQVLQVPSVQLTVGLCLMARFL